MIDEICVVDQGDLLFESQDPLKFEREVERDLVRADFKDINPSTVD